MAQEKLVMYVDGDPIVADAVALFGEAMNLGKVMIAHSVEEAVNIATKALPRHMDAVVFPTRLPDGSGVDLLNAKIGNQNLFGEDTAKVLVTADRTRETKGMYQKLVDQVVYKPIGPKKLTQLVGDLVNEPSATGREN